MNSVSPFKSGVTCAAETKKKIVATMRELARREQLARRELARLCMGCSRRFVAAAMRKKRPSTCKSYATTSTPVHGPSVRAPVTCCALLQDGVPGLPGGEKTPGLPRAKNRRKDGAAGGEKTPSTRQPEKATRRLAACASSPGKNIVVAALAQTVIVPQQQSQ